MGHNKDIKALHQWTGKPYKECRALMKANGWDLFKASGLGELPEIFKTARDAVIGAVDALGDMATSLREAISAVDWSQLAEMAKKAKQEGKI